MKRSGKWLSLEAGDFDYWHHHPSLDWKGEVALIHKKLKKIDMLLASDADIEGVRLEVKP